MNKNIQETKDSITESSNKLSDEIHEYIRNQVEDLNNRIDDNLLRSVASGNPELTKDGIHIFPEAYDRWAIEIAQYMD